MSHVINGYLRDPGLSAACTERCETKAIECLVECAGGDVSCISACVREETECIESKSSPTRPLVLGKIVFK